MIKQILLIKVESYNGFTPVELEMKFKDGFESYNDEFFEIISELPTSK